MDTNFQVSPYSRTRELLVNIYNPLLRGDLQLSKLSPHCVLNNSLLHIFDMFSEYAGRIRCTKKSATTKQLI
jgi:hypothetical protein